MEPIERMRRRIDLARLESDTALFHNLMYFGEMATKLIVVGAVAAIQDEKDRHRYRLEYKLARANGLGEWVTVLEDALTGPASQHLRDDARPIQRELTQRIAVGDGWQPHVVGLMRRACRLRDTAYEAEPRRSAARLWFIDFAWLRNHTRGHGAPTAESSSALCPLLQESLESLIDNLQLFTKSWAYVRRNLSGKYRVLPIAGSCQELEYLKGDPRPTLQDGIYVWFGHPCFVPLVSTDLDLSDFYIANGNYRPDGFEMLSYITDERLLGNAAGYVNPPTELPASETTALGALELEGVTFTNLPPAIPAYVSRPALESELLSVLTNDRHPIVSLIGRGGVGKTSLALEVLHRVTESERFMAILWFSSRDIDLLPEGPKLVRPDVLTDKDLAEQLVQLLDPEEQDHTDFDPVVYFARALTRFEAGPVLFVFDNFETVRSPSDLYGWLDVNIRLPNKILVTTRLRDFKADYPVEVGGMQESEFRQLVESTAMRLGIASVITPEYVAELYEEADGHPYVGKVMLGEVATAGRLVRVERVMAGREDVLEALFERTFAQLTPVAQRIFLTLSSWRSNVPRLALEAALLRPENERMDVEEGINALRRSSLVDSRISNEDGQEFLSVPLAAGVFGRRKLAVSPMATAIEADAELLQLIGAGGHVDIRQGIAPRVNRLFRAVARMAETDGKTVEGFLPVLEYIARGYSPAWLLLSDLVLEIRGRGALTQAEGYLRRYLEANPTDWQVWVRLAKSCAERQEFAGELSAYVQGSKQPNVPYYVVSTAANRVNQLLADGSLGTAMGADERRIVIRDLLEALEDRVSQADGTDYSRIAWLYMNLGDRNQARRYTEGGLKIEPANTHLLGLGRKLGI